MVRSLARFAEEQDRSLPFDRTAWYESVEPSEWLKMYSTVNDTEQALTTPW